MATNETTKQAQALPTHGGTTGKARALTPYLYGTGQGVVLLAMLEAPSDEHKGYAAADVLVRYYALGGAPWGAGMGIVARARWQSRRAGVVVHTYRHAADDGDTTQCVATHDEQPCSRTVSNVGDGQRRWAGRNPSRTLPKLPGAAKVAAQAIGRLAHYRDVLVAMYSAPTSVVLASKPFAEASRAGLAIDAKSKATPPTS